MGLEPVESKAAALKALEDADNSSFLTQNMEHISTLKQLTESLKNMREDVYKYHVGPGFNHFSYWIRDVFWDDELAHDIFSVKQKKAVKIIKKRVKWLEKKAK